MSNGPGRPYHGQGGPYEQPAYLPPSPRQAAPGFPSSNGRLPTPVFGSQPPQHQQQTSYHSQQGNRGPQPHWRPHASGSRGDWNATPPHGGHRQDQQYPPPPNAIYSKQQPYDLRDDGRWTHQGYGAPQRSYTSRSGAPSSASRGPASYARALPQGGNDRSSKSPEWRTADRFGSHQGDPHGSQGTRVGPPPNSSGHGHGPPRGPTGSYVPPASRERPPKSKRRTEPREAYLKTSLESASRLEPASGDAGQERKLILLDLNGSLVFRANKQNADLYRRRPFVGNFIEYLRQRWEVGVWSSAQPHSVEKMVQSIGLKTKTKTASPSPKAAAAGEVEVEVEPAPAPSSTEASKALTLKVVWARDTFGLTPFEYNQKTDTIKDLDLIWKHLNAEDQASATPRAHTYDALNTLLLDDSYTKTACQPFNHLPVPDFGQSIATKSARAYRAALALSKDGDQMPAEIAAELGKFVVDRSLLGIIGILERARREANVAAWIRAGGLVPDLTDPDGWWTAEDRSNDDDDGAPAPQGKKVKRSKKAKLRQTMAADDLHSLVFPDPPTDPAPYQPTAAELSPTAIPPVPWYASPAHADFWTRRGVDALLEMGIALDFAMAVDFLPPTREEIEASRAKREEKRQAELAQREQERASSGDPPQGPRTDGVSQP